MTPSGRVAANSRVFEVVDDRTSLYRALVVGTVVDELSGAPPQAALVVRCARADLFVKIADSGLFCLAGYPERLFSDRAADPQELACIVSAAGYRDAPITVVIAAHASLPVQITLMLRRLPVRLQGRVVENTTTRAPIAGARVQIVDGPAISGHVLVLRTPLRFDHAAGVVVRPVTLNSSGAQRNLTVPASAGDHRLTLNNRAGLGGGSILHLRRGPADVRDEYVVVESVVPLPANLALPGDVLLSGGLYGSFAAGAEAQLVSIAAPLPGHGLASAALAGDGVLSLAGALAASTVEVLDPLAGRHEYHAVGALTDSAGYYGLDGIGRFATLHVQASAGGFAPSTVEWTIAFRQPVNTVDFRL